MRDIRSAIAKKHEESGITINPPASELEIQSFRKKAGFELPDDFKEFYSICNGFKCKEDNFNLISLNDALLREKDYGNNWYHFAEYMTYCDMWSLRKVDACNYEILNSGDIEVVLTSSLTEFLQGYLLGNVFDKDGLYDWRDKLMSDSF